MPEILRISTAPGEGICAIESHLPYFCLAQNSTGLITYSVLFIFTFYFTESVQCMCTSVPFPFCFWPPSFFSLSSGIWLAPACFFSAFC